LSLRTNHEYIWRNGHTAAVSANLDTKFGLMVSLTFWPLYRRGERPSVPTAQEAASGQKIDLQVLEKSQISFAPAGIGTVISPTSVPQPSHYSDCYIAASTKFFYSVPNQSVMCVLYFFLERYIRCLLF